MLLRLANFYWRFIKSFSKIAAPLISMLKTTSSFTSINTQIKTTGNSIFVIPKAKLTFLQLRHIFTEALIFYYNDLQHYIRVQTNASGYTIDVNFS